ncbi:MAG: SAF domain-containing protein [Actinomycetes bacterium]
MWQLWRRVQRHRRLIVGVCAAVATGASVLALAPPPPATRTVLVARHALEAGEAMRASDVATEQMPVGLVPDGALDALPESGARLSADISAREVVTAARLARSGPLAGLAPGERAVAVSLTTTGEPLVRSGTRVELVLPPVDGAPPGVVPARLLTRPTAAAASSSPLSPRTEGGLRALVAVPASGASAVALAAAAGPLPFLLVPPDR